MAITLEIDIQEANSAADFMAKTNNDLKSKLMEIAHEIESMDSKWSSDTSRETVDKFRQVKNKQFNEYFDRVEKFVSFVKVNVTETYKKGERTIRINKESIQNDKAQAT